MKIRKYTAKNTQDAIAKVKSELGSEALIINTKKVRQKGLLGFFKKPLFEVTAAIDEQAQAKTKRLANHVREYNEKNPASGIREGGSVFAAQADVFSQFQTQLKASGKLPGETGSLVNQGDSKNTRIALEPEMTNAADGVNRNRAFEAYTFAQGAQGEPAGKGGMEAEQGAGGVPGAQAVKGGMEAEQGAGGVPGAQAAQGGMKAEQGAGGVPGVQAGQSAAKPLAPQKTDLELDGRVSDLENQFANIEAMISKVYREVAASSKMVEVDGDKLAPLAKVLRLFYNNLVRNEVEPEFSMNIIEKVNDSLLSENNTCDAATALYNEVASVLGKPETISIRHDKKPTVVIFVGPTGVGKTTTLAKIAADSSLNRELDVAMITADTYRIAAVQQLKTYAEILGIPVSVAYTPNEIKDCIAGYADKDLILIDTAGRSHRNRAQFEELRELVGESGADEVFLVLSATASVKNNREIIQNYSFLDEFKLIFTKADETPVFGAMLNARMLTGKCLSYVTVGQSVPDDIEVASVEKIARNLIGSIAE